MAFCENECGSVFPSLMIVSFCKIMVRFNGIFQELCSIIMMDLFVCFQEKVMYFVIRGLLNTTMKVMTGYNLVG